MKYSQEINLSDHRKFKLVQNKFQRLTNKEDKDKNALQDFERRRRSVPERRMYGRVANYQVRESLNL